MVAVLGMTYARKLRLVAMLLLPVVVCAPSAWRQARDEASVRKREAQAIDAQIGSARVRLYRALKTSVRSLPPRDELYRVTAGREELTRDEWAALAEREPALAGYRQRVGLLV